MNGSGLLLAALSVVSLLFAATSGRADTISQRGGVATRNKNATVLEVGPQLLVGGTPNAEEMRWLYRRGVRTLVSVDGMRPEVDLAKQHGLRYVHIPFGYDGVPREAALALTRVAREAEGVLYVHCHHGKHRGPAAAGVVGRALGVLANEVAVRSLLEKAGTDQRFTGLWKDALRYRPPPAGTSLPKLVAVAEVDPFVAAMAAADRAWAKLDEATNTDRSGAALLLYESLRESTRAARQRPAIDKPFLAWLAEAKASAFALQQTESREAFHAARSQLAGQCQRCHTRYRD